MHNLFFSPAAALFWQLLNTAIRNKFQSWAIDLKQIGNCEVYQKESKGTVASEGFLPFCLEIKINAGLVPYGKLCLTALSSGRCVGSRSKVHMDTLPAISEQWVMNQSVFPLLEGTLDKVLCENPVTHPAVINEVGEQAFWLPEALAELWIPPAWGENAGWQTHIKMRVSFWLRSPLLHVFVPDMSPIRAEKPTMPEHICWYINKSNTERITGKDCCLSNEVGLVAVSIWIFVISVKNLASNIRSFSLGKS